ncbi:MAG: response regulator [Patescibacteria group bacterium]
MSQKTILLAEDNPRYRTELRIVLESAGFFVVEAEDGQMALEIVQAGLPFDAIVTDYQMPRLNGAELVEALRQDGCTQPIIVWTAWFPLPSCSGADCVISKMNGLPAVIAAIQQCLRKRP